MEKNITQKGHLTLEYTSDFDLMIITRRPVYEQNRRLTKEIERVIRKDAWYKNRL